MKIGQKIVQAIRPYRQSMPDIIRYRLLTTIINAAAMALFRFLASALLRSTGWVAVSTGDFDFLFKTWQGPLLILLGIAVLLFYVIIDLNIQIIYASKILHGKADLLNSVKEGFRAVPKFFTFDGIMIVLYISLIAPIIGLGLAFSISLTNKLYIPSFITSVIESTPLYTALYWIFVILFFFLGFIHLFILHGILLGDLSSNKADDESRELMKANWKDFLKQTVVFFLCVLLVNVVLFLLLLVLPGVIVVFAVRGETNIEIGLTFALLLYGLGFLAFNSFTNSFYLIRMTQLYYGYKGEDLPFIRRKEKKHPVLSFVRSLAVNLAVIGLILLLSVFVERHFDDIFKSETDTGIIAHRAGGAEAPENTVAGIEKAIELGAEGAEIDIQRTKDGYYIVNHDGTFQRLCSNPARPSDLTLDEVKDLVIRDPNFPDQEEDVATFEEILDAANGKIILFVELKGDTADEKMVDDAVRIIKEKGMQDQCVLISLKYALIAYCEQTYPGIKTAYLTFASFGNTAGIPCDYLGLEEEAATSSNIGAVRDSGRMVLVWTPNSESSQKHFLLSDADYIITDQVSIAQWIKKQLAGRDRITVIVDWLFSLV